MPKVNPLPDIKQMIAQVEQSGKLKGDWAQLTPIVLKDLQQLGKFKNNTFAEVKSDPQLYEKVTNAYLKRVEDLGVPNDPVIKAIWWRAPSLYKKFGGDIDKIPDSGLRNVMSNRMKNLSEILPGGNKYSSSLIPEITKEGGYK